MMKELLRVSMNAKQIREACEEWAAARATITADLHWSNAAEGVLDEQMVSVVFRKTRAPKKKKAE